MVDSFSIWRIKESMRHVKNSIRNQCSRMFHSELLLCVLYMPAKQRILIWRWYCCSIKEKHASKNTCAYKECDMMIMQYYIFRRHERARYWWIPIGWWITPPIDLAIAFIAMTTRSLNTLTTDDKCLDAARPNDKMTSMALADKGGATWQSYDIMVTINSTTTLPFWNFFLRVCASFPTHPPLNSI